MLDFRRRFLWLLSYKFREFGSVTALSVLEAVNSSLKKHNTDVTRGMESQIFRLGDDYSDIHLELDTRELSLLLTPFDLKRLEAYANNLLDYHVILDLFPRIASLYFEKRLGSDMRLSAVQSSIFLALGLQRKTIEEVEVRLPPITS